MSERMVTNYNRDDASRIEQPAATGGEKTAAQVIAELTSERDSLRKDLTDLEKSDELRVRKQLRKEIDQLKADLQAVRKAAEGGGR